MVIRIHGQLMKKTCEQIAEGGGSEFPLTEDFTQTIGGPISAHELLITIWQTFKDKPFIITVEPTDDIPKVNRYACLGTSDKLQER